MKAAMQPSALGIQPVIHSLLKAMNQMAKDHNQQPQAGILSAKSASEEAPTNSEYGTGPWFMYHALSGERD